MNKEKIVRYLKDVYAYFDDMPFCMDAKENLKERTVNLLIEIMEEK